MWQAQSHIVRLVASKESWNSAFIGFEVRVGVLLVFHSFTLYWGV